MCSSDLTVILKKFVWNVVFKGNSLGAPILKLDQGVDVGSINFKSDDPGDPFALILEGNNTIGTLKFAKTNRPFDVDSKGASRNQINRLEPGGEATLALRGSNPLHIFDGTQDVKWNAEVSAGSSLEVQSAGLFSGEVTATLKGGILRLPCGDYPKLTLKTDTADSTIEVNAAEKEPVLSVKDITLSNGDLKMKVPATWLHAPKAGDTVILLKANAATLNGKAVKGDPNIDPADYWEVEELTEANKKLKGRLK